MREPSPADTCDEREDHRHVPRTHSARFVAIDRTHRHVANGTSRGHQAAQQIVRVAVARKESIEIDALDRTSGNGGVPALAVGEPPEPRSAAGEPR